MSEAAPVCCPKDKDKSFTFYSDVEEKIVEKFSAELCMIRIVSWANTDVWNGFYNALNGNQNGTPEAVPLKCAKGRDQEIREGTLASHFQIPEEAFSRLFLSCVAELWLKMFGANLGFLYVSLPLLTV